METNTPQAIPEITGTVPGRPRRPGRAKSAGTLARVRAKTGKSADAHTLAPSVGEGAEEAASCERCAKPTHICVCAMLTPAPSRHAVLLLQHPQEDDHLLGTAALLRQGLSKTQVRVGLSWASLAQALKREEVNLQRWALVFPATAKVRSAAARAGGPPAPRPKGTPEDPRIAVAPLQWHDRNGKRLQKTPRLEGIVLLDGTWKQAKTLLWRNPWLSKLTRLSLHAPSPSIYGRLRKEPKPGHRSTLEAVVAALGGLGEAQTSLQPMLKALRTLAQRLRDAR